MDTKTNLKALTNQEVPLNNKFKSIAKKLINIKVGVLPLPLYLILAAIIFVASIYNTLPADMIGGFAVIMILGILLGDLGQKIPILKDIGGPAILALLVPSILVFLDVIHSTSMEAVTTLMKTSNFLYFYISCLVVGSILGMNSKVLIQGFTRMFVPLLVGTVLAVTAGLFVGLLLGYDIKHTLFYIVVPIIGGGIGEGILPLSIAYSSILGDSAESFVSQMIPAAVIGNIFAVVTAGVMMRVGEKYTKLSGNGKLVKSESTEESIDNKKEKDKVIDFSLMGAGLLIACSFFIVGTLGQKFIGIPGPVIMILFATLIKCLKVMPHKMENGAHNLYKFVSTSLTWPLMVGLGMLYIPLEDVVKIVTPAYVVICASVVLTMIISGYFVGKLMKMYPVDAAIVTGCHSGLGGTGDVAILSASKRMALMPFAQVATRIGGVSTVIIATFLLKILS
ncbi:2-hydroxycarboxylate transporter family protein [Staphylococcus nepalensis]|uniref:2-hydroxycarboxylate transporter family protein n=1 Tax=Staphylococcus nepalensis TaxID=214473 RepID=A0ABS3L2C8_9STAP|nr:2-hydroxycarboxylate transporter family protein [Staphylococcus nepalensis]MBO1212208.1 2-hydroxycarboxylate transporter family protein [Staphylococcus nepalensis]MBO1217331.1 2-hydroxycarboxylate transporter family protein [Staphylococcus nepalensis]MBO1227685.1 2-hydroxycarboxylate transporter family protein [Staphylococcus nepalensis]MBO1235417.1 2-hydroxycarboxylate transporter family protein [Staphylococcus nepalensis]MBO1236655.1 2-hydroxycarboxylate transporter family protein [Staphy